MELLFTKFIFYFFAGIFVTGLQTVNIRFVSRGNALGSALVAFVTVTVSFGVLFDIIANLRGSGFWGVVVYAFGVGAGAYLGTRMRLEKEK